MSAHSSMKSRNIIYNGASVTREMRNSKNNHKSIVIWFTGLSGSGKSTLANAVEEMLFGKGLNTFVLDGDNIRNGLSNDLGFSNKDRKENIRRIGEVSRLMIESGTIVIAAFISPFREDRGMVRDLMPDGDFIEIYCKASIETCENRDVKGLYKLARLGKISDYTGIGSSYEAPNSPEIIVDTDCEEPQESVFKITNFLKTRGIIKR